MIVSQAEYPRFVADQLLTSQDLNSLFEYLDGQTRISRTNLVGIGLACGYQVLASADGTSVTLTGGTGVTSEGYLVALDDSTYTQHKAYDARIEQKYGAFFRTPEAPIQLWELFREAEEEGTTPLDLEFLQGGEVPDELEAKVALLFVELALTQDRNCNPESCDDKGETIEVAYRVLLARREDALELLSNGLALRSVSTTFSRLPRLSAPRFDVENTAPSTTEELLHVFMSLVSSDALGDLRRALTALYELGAESFAREFASDPFSTLGDVFAVDGNNLEQVIVLQYLYDHFVDLIAAYEEIRRFGLRQHAVCCPDAALFPRHLLLGQVLETPHQKRVPLRHGFVPSPALSSSLVFDELRSLFHRLAIMTQAFGTRLAGAALRCTPSRLGPEPLSVKAIPYYYQPDQPSEAPLDQWWNYQRTLVGEEQLNQSYHKQGTGNPAEVSQPLSRDLDDYNFLRIEGHIGRPVAEVLLELNAQITRHRLPFDVLPLALTPDARMAEVSDPRANAALHAQFEALKAELLCCLKQQAAYWGYVSGPEFFGDDVDKWRDSLFADLVLTPWIGIPRADLGFLAPGPTRAPAPTSSAPSETLTYEARDASLKFLDEVRQGLGSASEAAAVNQVFHKVVELGIPFGELLVPYGSKLTIDELQNRAEHLLARIVELAGLVDTENAVTMNSDAVRRVKVTLESSIGNLIGLLDDFLRSEDRDAEAKKLMRDAYVGDMLGRLRSFNCLCVLEGLLRTRESLVAWLAEAGALYHFASFAEYHPGIQHRAGVPLGGTFILAFDHRNSPTGPLAEALRKLDGRTVVADFYLPYRCCSLQPPIQIQIVEQVLPDEPDTPPDPDLAEPTLELASSPAGNANYSVRHTGEAGRGFVLAAKPAGGTLTFETTAANPPASLTILDADASGETRFRFVPAHFAPASDQASANVTFRYAVGGVRAETAATVFAAPLAVVRSGRETDQLHLEAQVRFADRGIWRQAGVDVAFAPVAAGNRHVVALPSAGRVQVTLIADQSETGESAEQSVSVSVGRKFRDIVATAPDPELLIWSGNFDKLMNTLDQRLPDEFFPVKPDGRLPGGDLTAEPLSVLLAASDRPSPNPAFRQGKRNSYALGFLLTMRAIAERIGEGPLPDSSGKYYTLFGDLALCALREGGVPLSGDEARLLLAIPDQVNWLRVRVGEELVAWRDNVSIELELANEETPRREPLTRGLKRVFNALAQLRP
jgi:hypothetical protein